MLRREAHDTYRCHHVCAHLGRSLTTVLRCLHCRGDVTKPNTMCYYLEPVKREMSTPMVGGLPADLICKKLAKRDDAICKLEWGEQLKTVRSMSLGAAKRRWTRLPAPLRVCFRREEHAAHTCCHVFAASLLVAGGVAYAGERPERKERALIGAANGMVWHTWVGWRWKRCRR